MPHLLRSIRTRPRQRWSAAALALLALLAALAGLAAAPAPPALALERHTSDTYLLPAGQSVDDDLVAIGRLIRIDGTVHGDVYAIGQTISIGGTIDGDLIALGQSVTIDGTVRNDVRAAGEFLVVNGAVDRNISTAAQSLLLGRGGRIAGNWLGAAETLSLSGDVGGTVAAAVGEAVVQGRIGRDAELHLQSLALGPSARIGGSLVYYADHSFDVPAQAVAGTVRYEYVPRTSRGAQWWSGPFSSRQAPFGPFGHSFSVLGSFLRFTWLVGSALVGLVVLWLFPRFVAEYLIVLESQALPSLGLGLAAVLLTPPVIIIMALTFIGIPVALVVAGSYIATLFFGWLLLAVATGTILVGLALRGRQHRRHLNWALLLGLLVLELATRIPLVGGLLAFLGASLGAGALLLALYRTWRGTPAPPAPAMSV